MALRTAVMGLLSFDNFVEVWDGTHWSTTDIGGGNVGGVSCASPTSCFVVGSTDDSGFGVRPNADGVRWDGTSWLDAQPVRPNGLQSALNGVSCPSGANCTAVGATWPTPIDGDGLGAPRTLVERWNGATWAIIPSPTPR
jgi:hypothetical protein